MGFIYPRDVWRHQKCKTLAVCRNRVKCHRSQLKSPIGRCVSSPRAKKFLPPPRGPHNKRKHKFRRLSPSLRVVPPRRCKKLAARATLATKALFFRLPPFVHAGIHPLLLLSRKGQREKADPDAVRFNLKLFKRGDSSFNSARPAERETKSTATVFHSHYVFTVCHRVEGGRRERERESSGFCLRRAPGPLTNSHLPDTMGELAH